MSSCVDMESLTSSPVLKSQMIRMMTRPIEASKWMRIEKQTLEFESNDLVESLMTIRVDRIGPRGAVRSS